MATENDKSELRMSDVDARRMRLKTLIVLGKERGYLTYAEINDHLPDDMLDAEQIEGIISMIGDMGISVCDEAPDAETLLMSDAAPTVTDEDVVEEAEAALSTVDSDFGRTTDPVRMYMREMGSVELLTREGEIEIAKRIEDGLKHMVQAISACPTTITEILALVDKVERDEMRVDELVDGLMNADGELEEDIADSAVEAEEAGEAAEELTEEEEEEAGAAVAAANLAQLKADALERFAVIRKAFDKMQQSLAKKGPKAKGYKEWQEQVSGELLSIRFSAKQVEFLCESLRSLVEEVRSYEREIMELCVTKSGMPRTHFIKTFPGNENNLDWVLTEIATKKPYCEKLTRFQHSIVDQQQRLLDLQERVRIPIKDLKEINRQMSTGEA
ncbi:MAG: RNA polymerase sigma factor RpoD, partial [Gammaproteobacteria bacterium]|nr:RNA polymerase sigma factor RpoD [Gammaproteobacteria bacterium]